MWFSNGYSIEQNMNYLACIHCSRRLRAEAPDFVSKMHKYMSFAYLLKRQKQQALINSLNVLKCQPGSKTEDLL